MSRAFDLIIFGVTGYTGKHVLKQAILSVRRENLDVKIAVAGRRLEAMKNVVSSVLTEIPSDDGRLNKIENFGLVVADVEDHSSLVEMTRSGRVILNLVGPYIKYGEPVVQACIEGGAHHVDVSGETQYLEKTQLEHHDGAKARGVYIVTSCGFGSIPSEIGVNLLKESMTELNSVDCYIDAIYEKGYSGNYGSWESIVESVSQVDKVSKVREKLYSKIYRNVKPTFKFPTAQHSFPFRPSFNRDRWTLTFPYLDKPVVERSQLMALIERGERPTQFQQYMLLPYFVAPFFIFFISTVVYLFSKTSFTRNLLLKYPRLFSLGAYSSSGPTKEQIEGASWVSTLVGHGWNTESEGERHLPPENLLYCRISGPDLGYTGTSICLVQSALTILFEIDKLPGNGGVLTPGYAFKNTSIVDRLNRNGVSIVVKNEI